MLTPEEKDTVRRLVRHMVNPPGLHPDLDELFWLDYGYGQVVQELPWTDDPDRADVLLTLANRVQARFCR